MTLPGQLCERTRERIVDRFALVELRGADGGPFLPLPAQVPGAPDGICRVWSGELVERVVYVGLAFPPAGLDSHMIFAFAPSHSPVPHFTLDAVLAGPMHAFHLDLIPRLDPGSHLAYLDAVYGEITPHFEAARGIEGLSAAALTPRQLALMSPWMLAYRADERAFAAIDPYVDAYLDQWTKLVESGLDDDALDGADGAAIADRDRRNRAALFNPDVDPVWDQITPLIGEPASARIRALLRNEE